MDRVFNFSAGPAALPLEVLQQAGFEGLTGGFVRHGKYD